MNKFKFTQKRKNEIFCLDYFAREKKHYMYKGRLIPFIRRKVPFSVVHFLRRHAKILFGLLSVFSNEVIIAGEKTKIIERKKGICPEEAYFRISDYGERDIVVKDKVRLLQLLDAKKWRLRFMEMYEEDVLNGSVPYFTLLGLEEEKKVPKYVAEFLAKTMLKGADQKLIRSLWENNGEFLII